MRLIGLDPYHEDTYRQTMRLFARQGLANQATAQFEALRKLLWEELGVEPDEQTKQLARQISAGEFTAPTSEVSPTHDYTHRVDWSEAPLAGELIGRPQESDLLHRLLIRDHCQVVALLGMGGLGKTTLAAHTARSLADDFEVVIWRSLLNAPLLDELLNMLLRYLADPPLFDLPMNLEVKLTLLLGQLRERRCLLILDDLETILIRTRPVTFAVATKSMGSSCSVWASGNIAVACSLRAASCRNNWLASHARHPGCVQCNWPGCQPRRPIRSFSIMAWPQQAKASSP